MGHLVSKKHSSLAWCVSAVLLSPDDHVPYPSNSLSAYPLAQGSGSGQVEVIGSHSLECDGILSVEPGRWKLSSLGTQDI